MSSQCGRLDERKERKEKREKRQHSTLYSFPHIFFPVPMQLPETIALLPLAAGRRATRAVGRGRAVFKPTCDDDSTALFLFFYLEDLIFFLQSVTGHQLSSEPRSGLARYIVSTQYITSTRHPTRMPCETDDDVLDLNRPYSKTSASTSRRRLVSPLRVRLSDRRGGPGCGWTRLSVALASHANDCRVQGPSRF
ncbi:uncharacterized protein BDW47DRAFT_4138 [Aspergillus candidus]|uniref:Uncharacterized protein n=1 Tax=Aspergillus candidus TaxID=41067 RepID=A0A2I2FH31_ASPCN|nr:hypothetical protein BDW47DRAFT_4138 [Aspergillus candidus]PLB39945.1 hypothetical protein BDW47DRAFT_4138 [Aspergillus candidus]